jgi:hypothetical protein
VLEFVHTFTSVAQRIHGCADVRFVVAAGSPSIRHGLNGTLVPINETSHGGEVCEK